EAVAYAKQRTQFGRTIIDFQGLEFLLADMAAAVESARATYLEAARRRDRGLPFRRQASIAKLVATDAAMKVTTDAVQVLGRATSPWSATCARPRSRRSSKAPTRSSAWSSPENSARADGGPLPCGAESGGDADANHSGGGGRARDAGPGAGPARGLRTIPHRP